jgi:hypothetical protein
MNNYTLVLIFYAFIGGIISRLVTTSDGRFQSILADRKKRNKSSAHLYAVEICDFLFYVPLWYCLVQ